MKKIYLILLSIILCTGLLLAQSNGKPKSTTNIDLKSPPSDTSIPNIEMVHVQGGSFTMGCTCEQNSDCNDNEKPAHQVTLSDYYIGKYEITQNQWDMVMGSNPSHRKGDNLPVENINWDDIQEFISKINALTGRNYRLPTEAEWEFAARGGNNSRGYKYSGCNNLDSVAWHNGNSSNQSHPVGSKSPNELGIYDMSGNILEWCSDWYESYSNHTQINPSGPSSGIVHILRGGSWMQEAQICCVSRRLYTFPSNSHIFIGLRLASS
ncbi:formylglycine-generating enzyme required for sulfatase activity [Dysgonomonas sp. PFB1-18]|uniref:formylglycine-generating enzyme family protein n=1 Tax=unclassified Dysgonomonas TaxID=2630389 RepID=UPI002475ED70|nr:MULTISPECIES: SUMF1/EgtB/PvdO family nonheme iron enzyme [unclassified Dysgonomonas]MDH6309697.1 formylglycine-generating enzyme required for sulfatase activity [Dysgonomonas sp. PF1-14]MDH6339295.1 formylglycine-generating enzyme required for sulfatase activity [Dysgonomonas sp. PF1-16]MDH6380794.1 formylglycine-generating enzyme required for sulfatase activity [Dysgonomonas sp. PFB1-18]MDH6398290.1 formylglycine-generating enzyme required for sulfatase activity [Dysgonomonas sp. PF1-23]